MTNSELIERVRQDIAELSRRTTYEQLHGQERPVRNLLDSLLQAQHEYYAAAFDKALMELYGMKFKDVLESSRNWQLLRLRYIVLSLYKKMSGLPTLRIANLLGTNRCSVRYAIIKYDEFSEYFDRTMKDDYQKLENKIKELI